MVLALLAFGVLARNLDDDHALLPLRFGYAGQLLFVVLFVLTGASLDFGGLAPAAGVAAAFIVARFLGKAVGVLAFGRLSGPARRRRRPAVAGAAADVGPRGGDGARHRRRSIPRFGAELAAVVLSAVVMLELLGPLAMQFALQARRRGAGAGERA